MLTAKAQYKLSNAEQYFKEHLSIGDYYTEGKQASGKWFGSGAERLGLRGNVRLDDFVKLCRSINPATDERLTQRRKSAGRRVFYDFTLSPPKSVSIVALVGGDRRIEESHHRAAGVALVELEKFAAARVRKNGASGYRITSNVAGAVFHHDSSRALDPHLHCHCIVFNATHDQVEDRWKALETYEMLGACKFVENVYYHELAKDLRRCGYELENKRRGDFEIRGVSQELIDRFAKRHREIDKKTQEFLESVTEKRRRNINDIRENIAHNERARKIKDIGRRKLESLWDAQLSADEKMALSRHSLAQQRKPSASIDAREAIEWAEDHLFDRRSVVRDFELWRYALERGRGSHFGLQELRSLSEGRYVRADEHSRKLTTAATLERERAIIHTVKAGIGRHSPLNAGYRIPSDALDVEQCDAVEGILSSRDFVTLFRGAAGTGKSFALKEVRAGLLEKGHSVLVVAPQRQQTIDLQCDFNTNAQTVSELLTRRRMADRAVVIVDEAGQIGAKQMLQLLEFVHRNRGRLILSGDTRQHGPVEASDALRAIEKYAGLTPIELTRIRRQNSNLAATKEERQAITEYRRSVDAARNGRLADSFDRLDQLGSITQCGLYEQQEFLTRRFLDLTAKNASVVVISQTWSEIHHVNEKIRDGLRAKNVIGQEDAPVISLQRLDLTNAQKRERRTYSDSTVLVINQDVAGLKRGSLCQLLEIGRDSLIVEGDGKIRRVKFDLLDHVTVCEPKEMLLTVGDRLQLKANAKTTDGRVLANGEIVTVKVIDADGRIQLEDGRVLPRDYRQFVRGYAVTSYAAQGKTADYVLFSDSGIKAATNQKQWYVTISRGRRGIEIFTTEKRELRENVLRSGERELAMELMETTSTRHLKARETQGVRRGIRA